MWFIVVLFSFSGLSDSLGKLKVERVGMLHPLLMTVWFFMGGHVFFSV